MADLPGNSNWFQKIGNGLKNLAHNAAMIATPGAVPAKIHTEGNILVQQRREEMQKVQMQLSWLQHEENLKLRGKLEEDRQVGMETLAAINHQRSLEMQKIAQQHQKELEEYRAMVQVAIQEKSIDFQKWKLQEEKKLQLTIINLRHELDLEIAKYNRDTALNNIKEQRRLANSPINLVSDDLLESPYSNGDMPLRILLSPPELNSDNSGQKSLGFKFENHLAEELREFLAQNYSFNGKQRQTQLLDGAWVSKKFRGGAGIQALHYQLKAVPTIVLESEADSNHLSFRVAYWRGDGSEPLQQSILSNYPYRDFLYESVRERAKEWQKNRKKLVDMGESQEGIKMIGGNNEFNLLILQKEQKLIESDIDISVLDIQKQYKLSEKDFQKLHQYLISLHCLSVGLIADIHYLNREKNLIPLIPSLLPELLKDVPNNNASQKFILDWLIPAYDSLYEKLEEFMAGWIPELRMEFAIALSNLEDQTYAKQQGEESLKAWLRNRGIKDYNRKLLKTVVTKDDRSYFESLQKFIEGIEDDSESLTLMRQLLEDWQLLDELDVISDSPKINVTDVIYQEPIEMIAIPGGTFMMGSPEDEKGSYSDERPQHKVTVQPFLMGKYPITQAQYQQVMGKNPSNFQGDERPVEQVSWDDAVEFCARLLKLSGREYRLPSEAEWEYACRAGTTTPYHFGENITDKLANYGGNVGKTTSVGQFPPNAFGLYDMHGNVWEWCQDDWHDSYKNAPTDGSAWVSETSSRKVRRGGSWGNDPISCRSASRVDDSRDNRFYYFGFRVVCVVPRAT